MFDFAALEEAVDATPSRAAQLDIRVSGLMGPLCTIEAHRSWSVGALKAAVEAAAGVPQWEQRLVVGGSGASIVSPWELRNDSELLSTALPAGASTDVALLRCAARIPEHGQ